MIKSIFPALSCPKNAPANSTYIGSLAPQLINPMINRVMSLSLGFLSVLAAIYAGTEHPKPVTSGMKLLPCSPNLWKNPSSKNATLAIYPVVSSSAMPKKSITIFGKNITTAPTPPTIPSATSEANSPPPSTPLRYSASEPKALSIISIGNAPTLNVS